MRSVSDWEDAAVFRVPKEDQIRGAARTQRRFRVCRSHAAAAASRILPPDLPGPGPAATTGVRLPGWDDELDLAKNGHRGIGQRRLAGISGEDAVESQRIGLWTDSQARKLVSRGSDDARSLGQGGESFPGLAVGLGGRFTG